MHPTLVLGWCRAGILILICILAFSSRLFSVLKFESVIHEFDPWFNYRTTIQLVENGFYDFVNWLHLLILGNINLTEGLMSCRGTPLEES
jgi:hypothetical protein